MQRPLRTISCDATIPEAIDALVTAHVSALPVLDRFGRAVGVISSRRILEAERDQKTAARRERLFEETRVIEVMQAWVATIPPDADVRQAAELMLESGEPRLFVKDKGSLVGVVSLTDVARAFVAVPA
jgi:CBS domain-containing protein